MFCQIGWDNSYRIVTFKCVSWNTSHKFEDCRGMEKQMVRVKDVHSQDWDAENLQNLRPCTLH